MNLVDLGWNDAFAEAFRPHQAPGRIAGRVGAQYRGGYGVFAQSGNYLADVSGRFRHQAQGPADFPAVGDWVVIEPPKHGGRTVIHALLPRRTTFSRAVAGGTTVEQVLAANIDDVFIVEALTADPNLRRLERFLTLAWESGATPTVLLTKSDLSDGIQAAVAKASTVTGNASILAVSGVKGTGIKALRKKLAHGRTGVLLGPSGVGKSTLINALCEDELQAVIPVRESDHKGRHTTTHRELFCVPGGGLIIDTPGLREIQLWEGADGVGETFADIESVAMRCRFSNCRHETEPGCAVKEALAGGSLDSTRFASYKKLREELAKLESRQGVRSQVNERRRARLLNNALQNLSKHREPPGREGH